jgi:proteasome lid subunit RPN8/RPN11
MQSFFFKQKGIKRTMWNDNYFGIPLWDCLPVQYGLPDSQQQIDGRAAHRDGLDDGRRPDVCPQEKNQDGDLAPLWAMTITQSAYHEILDYFRSREPEAAGILLGPAKDDVLVTHFVPDEDGDGTPGSFHLNALALNRVLERVKPAGMDCKGFIHSHPSGFTQPSAGDLAYLERLFSRPANAAALQCFMPIFCNRRLHPYVYANRQLWLAEIILV